MDIASAANQLLPQLASRLLPDDGGSVLPIIATVMFVLFFVGMFIFVFTDRRRAHHRRMEALILDDDAPDPWHPDPERRPTDGQ